MIVEISIGVFLGVFFLTIGATIFEIKRKRLNSNYNPLCSFIVPCYNSEKSIYKCINSIYNSYNKIDLIVINDYSEDNTRNILKKLKNKFDFRIINNKKNLGKTKSLNNVLKLCKGEIIFIVDSDVLINQKSVNSIMSSYEQNERIGCIGARIKIIEKGFFSLLVAIQYNLQSMSIMPYNFSSAISTWGGCLSLRKKALNDVKCFSYNCLAEDMDMVLRLNRAKWKVRMDIHPVDTYCPETFTKWVKQTIRWGAGMTQCVFNHLSVILKNPIAIIFFVSHFFFSITAIYLILKGDSQFLFQDFNFKKLLILMFYSLFYLPYILIDSTILKAFKKIPSLIFFSLTGYIVFSIISIISIIIGINKQFKLKKNDRGW